MARTFLSNENVLTWESQMLLFDELALNWMCFGQQTIDVTHYKSVVESPLLLGKTDRVNAWREGSDSGTFLDYLSMGKVELPMPSTLTKKIMVKRKQSSRRLHLIHYAAKNGGDDEWLPDKSSDSEEVSDSPDAEELNQAVIVSLPVLSNAKEYKKKVSRPLSSKNGVASKHVTDIKFPNSSKSKILQDENWAAPIEPKPFSDYSGIGGTKSFPALPLTDNQYIRSLPVNICITKRDNEWSDSAVQQKRTCAPSTADHDHKRRKREDLMPTQYQNMTQMISKQDATQLSRPTRPTKPLSENNQNNVKVSNKIIDLTQPLAKPAKPKQRFITDFFKR